MKRKLSLIGLLLFGLIGRSQTISKLNIIPEPVAIQQGNGVYLLKEKTAIEISGTDSNAIRVAKFLSQKISTATGFFIPIKVVKTNENNDNIHLDLINDPTLGNEGYALEITSKSVELNAFKPAGLFYGMQTLLQLFPKEIEQKTKANSVIWQLPVVSITDTPRFGWRGLMLDVTRHFFSKEDVKYFIDEMVRYKFNLLHLHLTDDQGWRLQIDSLPLLTQVGAWRPKREGKWGNTTIPDSTEPKNYGGFYSHDDIRELVKYAADRFVNILPEIDVPGHSMAALAAYPELSCTLGKYTVNVGEKFMDWHGNGKFSALIDNTLCPANEKVYPFLDKVFTEVADLFPFEYIHMGGDEAAKNFWQQSDSVKALMDSTGLKSMEEVQSYFTKRVQEIIHAKGKKMIGWDEILEGGLLGDAAVMSWRGLKGGIAAANAGHKVVMSPNDFVYLDLMQGDPIIEPRVYSSVRFNQSYKFDPLPEGIDSNMILGGQANLWTEKITQMRAAQYMLWPRGLAVAESLWSPKSKKNWTNFIQKTENEFQRMDVRKTKYSRSMYEPIFTIFKEKENIKVKMDTELPNLKIYYSFDETNPDEFYPEYSSTLTIPADAATLKVITYRDGKVVGRQINMPIEEMKKRVEKK